jgi:Kef-type K+ transport system membrane component KefB
MVFGFLSASPSAYLLMVLAIMWMMARLGAELCHRLNLPRVIGELGAGLALAALAKQYPAWVPQPAHLPVMEFLAEIGIVVLMFAVGLESTVPQMIRSGAASLLVAMAGVILPMLLGFGASRLFLPPGTPWAVSLFIGACMVATSISISAQVLEQKKALNSREGRVILGAAVLDDILGLLVLVAVSGLVTAASQGGSMPWGSFGKTIGMALGFLAISLTLGRTVTPRLFLLADRFRSEQILLPLGLGFAFLLAWLGNLAGLATIVGAYAAGLILEPAHIKHLEERELQTLEDLLRPLVVSLSPVFFVLMGAKIDPTALLSIKTLEMASILALLGILGKFAAGYVAGKGLRSSMIGWGMVPRGEVGLIFVATGSSLAYQGQPLLSPAVQAALVGAILLTTLAGPIGLERVLGKSQ